MKSLDPQQISLSSCDAQLRSWHGVSLRGAIRRGCRRLAALPALALLALGCASYVPLLPDGKWHAVRALQVQSAEEELRVRNVVAPRVNCRRSRTPLRTDVRVLLVESFQSLEDLPDRPEDAGPRSDGIPIRLADSGPYDLTLVGASRLLKLETGKQLIARTNDNCSMLKIVRYRR